MVTAASKITGLKDLKKPPESLFYKGTWDPKLFTNCAAVVGSRRITEYGRQVIKKLIPILVQQKITIVSGFMYGIDQEAHRECIACGGKTIAVLGWGINYPLENGDKKLEEDIIKNKGLLISEWEAQKPAQWTFPLRNRIVAAIAKEVFIVEAGEKSGSLITARIAIGLKRKIWAVPGPITSSVSHGTNTLIAQNKAKMWLPEEKINPIPSTNNKIVNLLLDEPLSASEISRKLSQPVSKIGSQLSLLMLSGEITQTEGKYCVN